MPYFREIINRTTLAYREAVFNRYFKRLRSNDIAVDWGANIGSVTAKMANLGAEVYAFEPNPAAFCQLRKRFIDNHNVHCIPKGVWYKNDSLKLYFHERAEEDPVQWSVGASVCDSKNNINHSNYSIVPVVDAAEFILSLNSRVKLLKIDIEGAEYAVLDRLISSGVSQLIDNIIVETHAAKNSAFSHEHKQLLEKISHLGLTNIRLDWF